MTAAPTRWQFEYDADVWLPVPSGPDDLTLGGRDHWAERATDDYLARKIIGEDDRPAMRQVLDLIADIAADGDGRMFAFLPDPRREFLPLFVHITPAEDPSPDALLDQLGARDESAIDPPQVTQIEAARLGEGVRVLRFNRDEDDGVCASLLYGWRHAEHDVVVYTQSYDIAVVVGAQEAIDAFLDGISPVTANG